MRVTRRAVNQIEAALDYVFQNSPRGAAGISARIDAVLDLLAEHPNVGQETSRPGVRRVVLTPYPYAVFYRTMGSEVVILRFRHGARKPI